MVSAIVENGDDWSYAANIETVRAAASRIDPYIHKTPVMTCSTLDAMSGMRLFFKCEMFQKGGAFKFRGACNSVLQLSQEEAARGVVTHSSGNHAGALAKAAQLRGIPAWIVVPRTCPACKQEAIRGYGAHVVLCDATLESRHETCEAIRCETGATFIPPYDDERVISGQGTLGMEFLEQVADLDVLVVPVSGGGLLSGVAVAAKSLKPSIKVVAAEPSGSNDAADVAQSKAAGQLVGLFKTLTIADGLQAQPGRLTWPIIRDLVDDVVVVSEQEIVMAMRLLFERMKVVVEPSGAVPLAAVMAPTFKAKTGAKSTTKVGVVLTGGNIDLEAKGLWDKWQAPTS